ncbi:MAG: hypothetical protein EBY58_00950 [Rhodobacteraceae bacterium]|nr:hypothetical protein [Paracoccaceae bacterium]
MEYAILGNAAFFAVAFAMQMGCLSWDMLGFGQNYGDVAVKNPDPEPDPEDAKNTNYTASDYASEQVGTSGNDTLGISTSTESVALFGLTGNDSLLSSSFDDDFEGDAGNDTVNGCSGNDAAYGGGGDDLFSVFGGMIPFMATRATI